MKVQNVAYSLVITALVILLLILAEPILVPFVIALLIWFVVKKTRNLIDKIGFVHRYIPRWLKTLAASFVIFYILFLSARILIYNIEVLSNSYDDYASNVEILAERIRLLFGIDHKAEITQFITNLNAGAYFQSFLNSLSEILGNMIMIAFYIVFIFIEESYFVQKVQLIATESGNPEAYKETFKKIDKTMSRYIGLKSLIALATATLGYFVFFFVGLNAPVFWAFLLFMMNFIPSIGPILASILPASFALLQFGGFKEFLIIISALTSISLLIGNFLEPRLMGNTLNISPLVAILSLAVWGSLWGITGMLLSVPITVALIIILSQFPSTRSIAILLSERGRV